MSRAAGRITRLERMFGHSEQVADLRIIDGLDKSQEQIEREVAEILRRLNPGRRNEPGVIILDI